MTDTDSAQHISIHDDTDIRLIVIDRPDRRNAFSAKTATEIREAVMTAGKAGVRAVVLTGRGDHFSAGGDATAISDIIHDPDETAALELMRELHSMVLAIWESPLPVIAAVSGAVYGGAFNLALSCDFVIASSDARFCQVFLKRGLAPDMGGAFLLPRLVGMHRAKQLIYLTEEISAEEARGLGMVNFVHDTPGAALDQAKAIGRRLARIPRHPFAATKNLLNSATGTDLRGTLELETYAQANLLRSEDIRDGFQDFMKR